MFLTLLIATHVSILTSDTSKAPRGNPFTGLRNAPLPLRGQITEDRRQKVPACHCSAPTAVQLLQHLRDLLVFPTPRLPSRLVEITEIKTIAQPHPHLVARTKRDHKITLELRRRLLLLAVTLGNVRADRFLCTTNLIGKRTLLDRRKRQAGPMNIQRHPISPLENFKVLKRNNRCSLAHRLACTHPTMRALSVFGLLITVL